MSTFFVIDLNNKNEKISPAVVPVDILRLCFVVVSQTFNGIRVLMVRQSRILRIGF